jgi:ADP-ribosylglycohydrolase
MNRDKLEGLIWGSFLGDAYNNNYHLSLYGKQSLWLLEYTTKSRRYDPFLFGDIWKTAMSQEQTIDKASKDTLANLKSGRTYLGAGSGAKELSVVGRHASILFRLKGMDEMLESIKFHTCLTHMTKETIEASKYIAEVTLAMIYNLDVNNTLQERAKFYGEVIENEVEKAFSLKDKPDAIALKMLGTENQIEGGLASTIYLILNYHKNFEKLLEVNSEAGGATSERAMIAGVIIGARYGFKAIKPSWIEEINEYEKLNNLISL